MKDKSTAFIFTLLVCCFALWGLLNNMTDNLVPAFQKIFTMDQSRAGLVQVAFYGAYAVLAIFAAVRQIIAQTSSGVRKLRSSIL